MKKQLLFIVALLASLTVQAQGSYYLYKEDWSEAKNQKEASYVEYVARDNAGRWVSYMYHIYGCMIRMESYADEDMTKPHGRFAWYSQNGKIDSTGMVSNGRKDGQWHYYTHPDSNWATIVERYNEGKLISRYNRMTKTTTYSDGRVIHDSTFTAIDSTIVQVEASFPGGLAAWRKFLEKNLDVPVRFQKLVKNNGRAKVVVAFTVKADGALEDFYIFKSAELSVDLEALRVIQKGPNWIPARQNGVAVRYRQLQAITFVVEED